MNPLLINITGMIYIFHHTKKTKKFKQNNKTIALNVLFIPRNTKTVRLAYKSKYNRKSENQVVLLMIADGKKWHYLALKSERILDGEKWYNRPVRSLSRLLRGIKSNHNRDFYCLNCFHSYRTDNKLKKHEKLCCEHDYCHVEMPTKDNKNIKIQSWREIIKISFHNLC